MKRNKGYLYVIISSIIFGLMPLFAKFIYENGGNALSLIFYRYILSLPVLYAFIKKDKSSSMKITIVEFKKLLLLSLFGYGITGLLLFISYNYISTGMATTIHYVYPIFVIIGLVFFHKEKINLLKIISVVFCTIGVGLFSDDTGGSNLIGVIIAFMSGITYAFYIVNVDKWGLKDMNLYKLTFYLSFISAMLVLIYGIITKTFIFSITLKGWIATVILSFLTTVVGVVLFQSGIKIIGPQSSAIFSTFEPITSVLIGIIVFKEIFNIKTFIGSLFILLAVIITARNDSKETKENGQNEDEEDKDRVLSLK